jgi:TPR repeat protein
MKHEIKKSQNLGQVSRNSLKMRMTALLPMVAIIFFCFSSCGKSSDDHMIDKALKLRTKGDYQGAYEKIIPLLEEGNIYALSLLGIMYVNGEYILQDSLKAFEYYSKYAKKGEARGLANLGIAYFNGYYIQTDLSKAAELFKRSAEGDYTLGQYYYAQALFNGYGTDKNLERAAEWYEKASSDNIDAMNELGMMYLYGIGVGINLDDNFDKGIALVEKAAQQGHSAAKKFMRVLDDSYKKSDKLLQAVDKTLNDEHDLGEAYIRLHRELQREKNEKPDFDGAIINFLHNTRHTRESLGYIGLLAEYKLLLSLVEFEYNASPSAQNLFLLSKLLENELRKNGHRSFLDTFFAEVDRNLAKNKEQHQFYRHYLEFKALSGTMSNLVIQSLRERLYITAMCDTMDIFSNISHGDGIDILANLIILTFGDAESAPSNITDSLLYLYLYADWFCSIVNEEPVKLTDLRKYDIPELNKYIDFYNEVDSINAKKVK